MKTADFISILDSLFPQDLQEGYDNTGEQIIFPDGTVTTVLLALDLDDRMIDEALEEGAEIIVTHHPLLFRPVKKIVSDQPLSRLIIRIIKNNISLYSAHTNLDRVYFDKLGEALGFTNITPLLPEGGGMPGIGALASLDCPVSLRELIDLAKKKLSLEQVMYTGNLNSMISRIALVNGAGGGLIDKILAEHSVDCIVTGDVGHHHGKSAEMSSVAVIDAGHFGTERILLHFLKEHIHEYLKKSLDRSDIRIKISEYESSPFRFF